MADRYLGLINCHFGQIKRIFKEPFHKDSSENYLYFVNRKDSLFSETYTSKELKGIKDICMHTDSQNNNNNKLLNKKDDSFLFIF